MLSEVLVDQVSCSRTSTSWDSKLVEHELRTLPGPMSSLLVLGAFILFDLLLSVQCFVDHCVFFCHFFGYCIVSPSHYDFWLSLCYLQTILTMFTVGIHNSRFYIGYNFQFLYGKFTPVMNEKCHSPILSMIVFSSKHVICQNMYLQWQMASRCDKLKHLKFLCKQYIQLKIISVLLHRWCNSPIWQILGANSGLIRRT